jgi:hypothetical protein
MAPLATKMSRRHELSLQERQMIVKAHAFFLAEREARPPGQRNQGLNVRKRTASCLGVSEASVGRIVAAARRDPPPVEEVCKLQRFVSCFHGILSPKLSFLYSKKKYEGAPEQIRPFRFDTKSSRVCKPAKPRLYTGHVGINFGSCTGR